MRIRAQKYQKPFFRPLCALLNPLKNRFVLKSLLIASAVLFSQKESRAQETKEKEQSIAQTIAPLPFQQQGVGADDHSEKTFNPENSPSYQHYFAHPLSFADPIPSDNDLLDPSDPRNGATYKKFFIPVADRSPRIKKRRAAGAHAGHEHLGAIGHRRHKVNIAASTNAETTIGRATLEHFAEGTNALQALAASTPGASFQSSDASGLDAFANTFYLRGYNQTQLGFTMDGIPLGSQGYGGKAGADANQIIIQENIAALSASQGAGGLSTPSATTLGGTVTYTTLDPNDKFGVHISQQFGSFSGYRTFGKLDSGKLNKTGTKFAVSFLRNAQDLWTNSYASQKEMDLLAPYGGAGKRPYGYNREESVNFKFVQPLSNFGKITVTSNWADQPEYGATDNTASMKKTLGYGDYNFAPDYNAANNLAGACNKKQASTDLCNLVYGNTEVQRVYLEGLKADFQISPSIKSSTVAYGQVTDSRSGTASRFYKTPDYAPGGASNMGISDEHTKGRRVGATQNFSFLLGHRNTLRTGVWYENNRYHAPKFFYPLNGANQTNNDFDLTNANGVLASNSVFTTNTFQFYIEDGFKIARDMTFTYGFKSLVQTENGGWYDRASDDTLWSWGAGSPGGNGQPASYSYRGPYGRLTQSNAFLPHFNYDWKFLKKHEFYFDVAENMRPIDAGGAAWSYKLGNDSNPNSGQAAFEQEKKNLRGERTWNYVVGYRYSAKAFDLGLDYYHTDYIGRLGTVTIGNAASSTQSQYLADLGNEKMDGMDLVGLAHLSHMLRIPDSLGKLDFMNSFSYNHAVYEGSVPGANGTSISLQGVQQVNYPRYMYKTNLHYMNGRLAWDLNVNYNSRTNVTYSGDVKNPGYWTSEFTGSLLLGPQGHRDQVKLAFSVSNLFGQHYTTQINNLGTSVTGDKTPNLTWAAPREFFGSINVAF
ncbi:TonB-dependent receptor [Acetobacteraceae bacterium]|nr:TonB-dependent receptor [Acetobacteraceae bacterium]